MQAPLAIITTYNDHDIAPQILLGLLRDGIHVHVMDNWSSDGTFETLGEMVSDWQGAMTVERFPSSGPSRYFELRPMLRHKQEIAMRFPDRWIIHQDSDEVLCSPWPDVSLHEGIRRISDAGFSALAFSVAHFRPVDNGFRAGANPEQYFRLFEWATAPLKWVRVWRQPGVMVDLMESGGHDVRFEGRRVYPDKFVLKHYPIRNLEQGRRKIFGERLGRFDPAELAAGWHVHYRQYRPDDVLLWDPTDLIEWSPSLAGRTTPQRWNSRRAALQGASVGSTWRRSAGLPLKHRLLEFAGLLFRRARWWINARRKPGGSDGR